MLYKMFSIYDSKSESFSPPFSMRTVGEVERNISNSIANPEHQYAKFTEDFSLFELGSFEDDTAIISLHKAPIPVGSFLQYKKVSSVS